MRSARSRAAPRLQGANRARARAGFRRAPGSAGAVVVLPLPRPARPLATRRSAPPRPGTGDALTPSCGQPAPEHPGTALRSACG